MSQDSLLKLRFQTTREGDQLAKSLSNINTSVPVKLGFLLFNALKTNTQAPCQSGEEPQFDLIAASCFLEQKCSCCYTPRRLQVAELISHSWGRLVPSAEWVAALESASCIHSYQAINTGRTHWHFKSSLRARAIDQGSGFFLGPWQGARCRFWSFSPAARQSKTLALHFLRMKVMGVPILFLW